MTSVTTCDVCRSVRVFDQDRTYRSWIDADHYDERDRKQHLHFCSWRCLHSYVVAQRERAGELAVMETT